MIAFVRGRVHSVQGDAAIVEVGGVGMLLSCTPRTLATLRPGSEATLATSLVVREDSLTLFGFADADERAMFELLQTSSGVGPKLAQAMLAVHGPDDLRRAVRTENLVALCAVPGIGRKGAQRIVLELKDRIGPPAGAGEQTAGPTTRQVAAWRDTVRAGLVGLGWSAREAESALDAVAGLADEALDAGDTPDPSALLRAALRSLARA